MIKINLLKSELMKKNYSIKNVAEWLGKSEPAESLCRRDGAIAPGNARMALLVAS